MTGFRVAVFAGATAICMLLGAGAGSAQAPPARPRTAAELDAAIAKAPRDPALHVARGLAYWDQGDQGKALASFERAVAVGPTFAEAHNWLGVARMEKADLPGAIAALRQAIALDPRHGRAHTNLGAALVRSGDYAAAVEAFRRALALEPNAVAAHMNLGMALREHGDVAEALTHIRQVATAAPEDAGVHYELAQTLRQGGDLPGAIAAFEQAIALDPELREGYYGLGQALKQQAAARPTGAAAAASPSAEATTPSPAAAAVQQAQDAMSRGDREAARRLLEDAVRLDDRHAEARTRLGFLLGQGGDLAAALPHLERAVALRPDLAEARYNLGAALWYRGDRAAALPHLRESVRLDPADGAAHAFLGVAERDAGDLAAARRSLQRAIALLPPAAAVYVDLGIVFGRLGEIDRAIGQFEAGLNLPPGGPAPDWAGAVAGMRQAISATTTPQAEAHDVLGRLLGRQGAASADVLAAFREAIRIRPEFAAAHDHLGLALIQTGDEPAGIAALREAVRLAPESAEARTNLGAALTPTDVAAAIGHLETAVGLAPTSSKAHFNLAVAYGTSPDHGPARQIAELRKVLELSPDFARAHVALGKALLQQGTVPEAVSALETAVKLEPDSGEAHYQLGLALARAGRKEDAAAALQKGRELVAASDRDQRAGLDLAEGRAALERGQPEQAVASLQRAVQGRPDSIEAQRDLERARAALRDRETPAAASAPAPAGTAPTTAAAAPAAAAAAPAATAPAAPAPSRGSRPADDPAIVAAVEAHIRESRFADAEPIAAEYTRARPDSAWGWYALGYSQFAQQKIGEAIRALAKSLEIDIHNPEAHKILGRTMMLIGRFDAARVEFEAGLRDKPDSAELHYNLGKLASMQDDWPAARTALEAALRIDPGYVEALEALGFAREALGDDEGAVAAYTRAAALNDERKGSFAAPHVSLSAYYNRTDRPDQALVHANRALELDPKSDRAWFQKGRADERQGRLEDAVIALNQAIAHNSRASSYYYVLAGVCRRLGWNEDSQDALKTFKRLEQESRELDEKRRKGGAPGPSAPPRPGSQP